MRGMRIAALLGVLSLLALAGCGGGSSTTGQNVLPATQPQIVVNLAPQSPNVRLDDTLQFVATVTGSSNTAVTWQVNGVTGGAAATGTISTTGLYTPPATVPATARTRPPALHP